MSENASACACLLLSEYFGDIVKNVAKCLMTYGSQTVVMISKSTALPLPKIRGALKVLIQHDMVDFQLHQRGYVEYSLHLNRVLQLMRYPRYISFAKYLQIEAVEFIIEAILLNGQMQMTEVVRKVTKRMNEALKDKSKIPCQLILDKFENLVKMNVLVRCSQVMPPSVDEKTPLAPNMELKKSTLFAIPEINHQALALSCVQDQSKDDEPSRKKTKYDDTNCKQLDTDIYWKVNYDRIHQYLRDQIIISGIENRIDKRAGNVARFICDAVDLRSDAWTIRSNPASRYTFEQEMKKANKEEPDLDKYLALLSDDSSHFIVKEEDSQGGLYAVNRKQAIIELTYVTLESLVQERFGSKCLRIFRLVRLKKYLEQQHIEQMAMIPPKDAKELTYKLFSENFLHVKEISRTPDHSPSRTFYIFYIDLPQVVQTVLEWCYKAVANLMTRRELENQECRRLIEKQERVEAIIMSLKESGSDEADLKEVEEMVTPPEKAQLEKIQQCCRMLELCEMQIDETIFILQLYLTYFKEKA